MPRLTQTQLETLAAVIYNSTEAVRADRTPEITPFGLQSRLVQLAYRQAAQDAAVFFMNAEVAREKKLRQIIEGLFEIADPGPVKKSLWQAYLAVKMESEEQG